MKAEWQTKKLGEICDIERGGSPRPIKSFITKNPDGINWIKISDATASGKYIFKTEEKIRPEGAKRSRMVHEGDFILSNSMSFGRPYIMETAGCIHDGWLVLHQPKVDPDYLYYVLGSDLVFNQFDRLAAGSTVRNLNIRLAKSVEIPYPPLPEQQRIVAILDQAFASIATAKANAEKNLLNARALFESHLQSIFTNRSKKWIERSLGDIATFRNGINFTKSSLGESIKIVGVKDFQKNFWAPLENLDSVTTDGPLPDSDALKEGDILFVRSNGNPELIGRSVLVGPVAEKVTHSGFTIRARLNGHDLSPQYLCHFLKSSVVRREMIDGGIGTNIRSLNQTTLSALVIPFPSISEQARIVDRLETLNSETQRLASIYQRKLAALDELKQSLLHQAFSGQL